MAMNATLSCLPGGVNRRAQRASCISAQDVGPASFLLAIRAPLVVPGCVLEIISATIIVTPMIPPIVQAPHIDLIPLAIVLIVKIELGLIMPPVGMSPSAVGDINRWPSCSRRICPS